MENVLYPVLKAALAHSGPIDLKNLIAQSLHMGDEVHNRNRAGTSLLYRALAPAIVATCANKDDAYRAQLHQRQRPLLPTTSRCPLARPRSTPPATSRAAPPPS
jgi:hypothetical protein